MWKRVAIVFIIAILAFVFFGIMTKGRGWNRGVRAVSDETVTDNILNDEENINIRKELEGIHFTLADNSGERYTDIYFGSDGKYEGEYYRPDMSDTGTGYSKGTVYLSNFSGKCIGYDKISRYIYEIYLGEIKTEVKPGRVEVINNIRYVYSDVHGIDKSKKLMLYRPGAKIFEMPDLFYNWISESCYSTNLIGGRRANYSDIPEELTCYGLYSKEDNRGFYSIMVPGRNIVCLKNRAKLPGLENKEYKVNKDGSYYCLDESRDGKVKILNLSFESGAVSMIDEYSETLVRNTAEKAGLRVNDSDMMIYDRNSDLSYPEYVFLNGDKCITALWKSGSGTDEKNCAAKIIEEAVVVNGENRYFTTAYIISLSEGESVIPSEGLFLYLRSITKTGDRTLLSSASTEEATKTISANVTVSDNRAVIYAENINDASASSGDADIPVKEYILSDHCPIYLISTGNSMQCFMNRNKFNERLKSFPSGISMYISLDKNDKVTFLFENFQKSE